MKDVDKQNSKHTWVIHVNCRVCTCCIMLFNYLPNDCNVVDSYIFSVMYLRDKVNLGFEIFTRENHILLQSIYPYLFYEHE